MNESLINKIRHLLAKTVDNGCSEAEASTALAMAGRLMDEHRISREAIDAEGDDRFGGGVAHETKREDIFLNVAGALCQGFYGVKFLLLRRDGRSQYVLFGTREDFEVASFVFGRIVRAGRDGWQRYRADSGAPASRRKDYADGFMRGVAAKLETQRARLELDRPGSGRELARLSTALESAFEQKLDALGAPVEENRELVEADARADAEAVFAGWQDGMTAPINREIGP